MSSLKYVLFFIGVAVLVLLRLGTFYHHYAVGIVHGSTNSHGGQSVPDMNNYFIDDIIYPIQHFVSYKLTSIFSEPYGPLVLGIVFGIDTKLNSDLKSLMRVSGLMHIIVASGYNISFLISLCIYLRYLAGFKWANLVILILLLMYAAVANFEPPIMRAFITGVGGIIASSLGRKQNPLVWLCYSAILMVVFNPEIISSLSFQLSCAATLGTLLFSDRVNRALILLPEFFRESVSGTLAAQLCTAPIIMYVFGEYYVESILINGLVLMFVPYVFITSCICVCIACISTSFGALSAFIPTSLLKIVLVTSRTISF
ncbi:ComEC/Rec2 family competence protein [candidate division WWE3 bacterium]|nr:ComEC/Rec2 family competence protein [candidate division WWE3 bacterium]